MIYIMPESTTESGRITATEPIRGTSSLMPVPLPNHDLYYGGPF